MNDAFQSLLVGVLIGDGYIAVDRRDDLYYLSFQHSLQQEAYARHKAAILENITGYRCNIYQIAPGNKRNAAIRVQLTLPRGEGRYYRELFYPNQNKTITRRFLNWMDERALAWWYQDDGSLTVYRNLATRKAHRYIKWCTHGYTLEENTIMQHYLDVVHGIQTTIRVEKQRYHYLHLGAIAAQRLFSIIEPHVHPSMMYKLDLKY